jgi:hypothetical protein
MHYTISGKDLGAFLMPPSYNTGRTTAFADPLEADPLYFTRAKYRYVSEDIRNFGQKFQTLNHLIFNYETLLVRREDHSIAFCEAVGASSSM